MIIKEGTRVRLTGRAWGTRGREVYARITFADGGFAKVDDQVVLSSGIPVNGYEVEVAPLPEPVDEAQVKAAALREAVAEFESNVGLEEFREQTKRPDAPRGWATAEEAWEHQGPFMDWLRNRADQIEAEKKVRKRTTTRRSDS